MVKIYQVDAFTEKLFGGNPAAVVPLDSWIDDSTLQAVAAENNLAETAFIVPVDAGFELRWFTPTTEVALCGHATLAAAHVLFNKRGYAKSSIDFITRESGTLSVEKGEGEELSMSFPSIALDQSPDTQQVKNALLAEPVALYIGHYSANEYDYVAVFDSDSDITAIELDPVAFKPLTSRGVIVTAQGQDCDFVSRYFAPNSGINEDPVTGSAHCLLAPYWAAQTGKQQLLARQLSARGGVLRCRVEEHDTVISGSCVDYLEGELALDE